MAGPRRRISSTQSHSTNVTAIAACGCRCASGRHKDRVGPATCSPDGWRSSQRDQSAARRARVRDHSNGRSIPQGAATSVWAAVVAPADESVGDLARTATWQHGAGRRDITAVSEGVRDMRSTQIKCRGALLKKSEELVESLLVSSLQTSHCKLRTVPGRTK